MVRQHYVRLFLSSKFPYCNFSLTICRTIAYIPPLAWYKLETMTVKRTKFSSLLIGPVLLATSLAAAPVAWSTETAPGERNAALNALHSLSDRASDLAIRAMAMVGIRYQY